MQKNEKQAKLVVIYGEKITVIELSKNMILGRNTGQNKVDISMDIGFVSRLHGEFSKDDTGYYYVDTDSTNGTYLNDAKIQTNRKYYLKHGDVLSIFHGTYSREKECVKMLFELNHTIGKSLDIRIDERSVWQHGKKLTLLQNINIQIQSGEMVLILGGSGAGKTTFMNAVMGYEKADGCILHGETDIYEDFESVKYKIGFVPQQDLLRGSDSVYDTLENAAQMKLPNIEKKEREVRIKTVLNDLGLTRETDTLVSKLSGGQRKRLSIAVEYIADPSLFFLDEPDSGLDGIMARTLMDNLRDIADEGKIVMVISHGPNRVADLFDKVIVLAKSTQDNCGHLAYFGTVQNAYEFFDTNSLEGVVRRINRKDEGGDGMSDFYINKYNKLINCEG